MQEVISNIVSKSKFSKKQAFETYMNKCLHYFEPMEDQTPRKNKSVIFRMDVFFKDIGTFINELGKDKKYETGATILFIIFEELGLNLDECECFILYHLRDLGKFRKKESTLLSELSSMWGQHKEYKLEGDDFSRAIRSLRDEKVINYRKGNLHLNPNVVIHYRN